MQREEEDRRRQGEVATAWHGVALYVEMMAKKGLPDLSEVLERLKPKKRADPVNVATQVSSFFSRFGIPGKPLSEETRAAMWKPVRMDG